MNLKIKMNHNKKQKIILKNIPQIKMAIRKTLFNY